MESRKRKNALEQYLDCLGDTPDKLRNAAQFYTNLRLFYRRKWNVPLKVPTVQGVEINLQRLYEIVMAFGGWQKVSSGEKWQEVADALGVGEDVVCGEHAIKVLYMRYLCKYEQNETVGDIEEMMEGELSRSRGRITSFFATNECPVSQARVNEYLKRDERGNPSTEPDYNRLVKSLMSGLPNEVDFAINVCTLLSHPGPRLLRLAHAPNILTLLVAICAIYDEDEDLSDLHETWRTSIGHEMRLFWAGSGVPSDILHRLVDIHVDEDEIEVDSTLFSGVVKEFDYRDPTSWRINQVACIFRNLSFEAVNRVAMAQSWPLIKYLILCASCKWPPLYTAALDSLGNLASDIDLRHPKLMYDSGHSILLIINDGIFSNDKFRVIRCMEILTGLASFEGNEELLCDFLSSRLLERLLDVTGVKDIMMCVYALECIYQISEMGDVACSLLASSPRAVNQLVSMATIEAVSFGTAGLAGMKVVEYQQQQQQPAPGQMQQIMPGGGGGTGVQGQSQAQTQQGSHQQMYGANFAQHPAHQHQLPPQQLHNNPPPPSQSQYQQQPRSIAPMPVHSQPAPANPPPIQSHSRSHHSKKEAPPPLPTNPKMVPISAHINGNVPDSEVERLTEQWIRQSCVFDATMSTPRGELYAAYVDDLRNQYHSLSGSLAMFSNVMKQIYPDVAFKLSDNGLLMVAQGIRLIRPHKLAPAASAQQQQQHQQQQQQQQQQSTAHPLMRQMLAQSGGSSLLVNGNARGTRDYNRGRRTPPDQQMADARGNASTRSVLYRRQQGNGVTPQPELAPPPAKYARRPVICTIPSSKNPTDYMCEWDGCGAFLHSASAVLVHVCKDHLNETEIKDTDPPTAVCKWTNCDGTPRNKWSLVTHVQDHHTQESQLAFAAQLRRDGRMPLRPAPYRPELPRELPPHPGYSKHAAIDAIRRHAFNFLPREITDEPEGPVTKSLRLTSCLILRNLARYSAEGRHQLRRHEPHLCWLALSRLESSNALAQLLAELNILTEESKDLLAPSASSSNLALVAPASAPSSEPGSSNAPSAPPSLPSTPQHSNNFSV